MGSSQKRSSLLHAWVLLAYLYLLQFAFYLCSLLHLSQEVLELVFLQITLMQFQSQILEALSPLLERIDLHLSEYLHLMHSRTTKRVNDQRPNKKSLSHFLLQNDTLRFSLGKIASLLNYQFKRSLSIPLSYLFIHDHHFLFLAHTMLNTFFHVDCLISEF